MKFSKGFKKYILINVTHTEGKSFFLLNKVWNAFDFMLNYLLKHVYLKMYFNYRWIKDQNNLILNYIKTQF